MFKNKVILITGGSSGIGAASAILFAKENAKVVIIGRNDEKLTSVAKQCEYFGEKALVIKADISKDEEAKTVVEKTVKHFGKLDILINNAGTSSTYNNIEDKKLMEVYDKVMGINLRPVFLITHLAIPELVKSKGNIINIASVFGLSPVRYNVVYSTSKAAMIHFTKCVALEVANYGIRVNAIAPGPVETDFIVNLGFDKEMSRNAFKAMGNNTPLKRVTESEEVGELVLYLASDKAKSVTGSVFSIDVGTLLVGSESINR